MFDFDALAEKQNKRSSLKSFKALLLNDKWFAVRGNNKYPIELEKDICNKFRYRFSSNTNDYYSPFTIKKYYTINKMTTECAFNGRTLSVRCGDNCADDTRYCSAWASNMPSNDTFHNTNVPDKKLEIKKE